MTPPTAAVDDKQPWTELEVGFDYVKFWARCLRIGNGDATIYCIYP